MLWLLWIKRHGVEIAGKHMLSLSAEANIVGKPVSILLQQQQRNGHDVSLANDGTFPDICRTRRHSGRRCQVSRRMVKGDWIKPGAAVMDVGVSEADGELVGDVDFEAALGRASLITPSRRGIGPLTITMLLRNTLHAYRTRKSI